MHNFSQSLNKMIDGSPAKRSSSQKIDLLYLQFENLKARIHTSTNKKKEATSINSSVMVNQSHQKNISHFKIEPKIRDQHSQKYVDRSQAILNDSTLFFKIGEEANNKTNRQEFQLKYLIKRTIDNFINCFICKFENDLKAKIENLDKKLKISQQTIKKIQTIFSIKKLKKEKDQRLEPVSIKINNNEAICDIVLQYELKINELIEDYERKIEVAQQKGKDKQTYSSTIRSRELNSFEKEIMQKETQINKLKLNNHKLKRNYDQTKDKYENCLRQIQEMEYKACIRKDGCVQAENYDLVIKNLKQELESMKLNITIKDIQIERLNQVIMELNQKYTKQPKQEIKIESPPKELKQRVEIQNIPLILEPKNTKNQQFYTELEQIQADLSIFDEQFTKSQIIQPKRKKEIMQSLKSLELQVNLITEENKHLQSKKVLFQTQLKNTEEDQERFVQQSNLLKAEIKRLNNSLQLLDKIICQFIKDGKFDNTKVEELPHELKSKAIIIDFGKQNSKKK